MKHEKTFEEPRKGAKIAKNAKPQAVVPHVKI